MYILTFNKADSTFEKSYIYSIQYFGHSTVNTKLYLWHNKISLAKSSLVVVIQKKIKFGAHAHIHIYN